MNNAIVRAARRACRSISELATSRRAIEPLEQRTLLATTLFLDFGAGVGVGGSIATTVGGFRDIMGANTGTDLTDNIGAADGDAMTFTPLNYDFDGNSVINNADLTALANAVLPLVQRSLEPFDIDIAIGNATSIADAVTAVGNNAGDADGEFDAYVFIMLATANGGNAAGSTTLFGEAALTDLGGGTGNTVDEASITFADNVFNSTPGTQGTAAFNTNLAQRLGYTATHEAFHTFAYRHTPDEAGGSASANQRLLASGDVIRRGSVTRDFPFIVTRYDLLHTGGPAELNNYLFAANDADIGLRDTDGDGTPDLAYSTGTGAHDEITYADSGGGIIDVDVEAYSNSARTTLISSETYNIDLASDTEGEVLVDASINADEVRVDGSIATSFRIRGGTGLDGIATEADLLTFLDGGLTGTFTPGPDGINGSVTYSGGFSAAFSEFENVEAGGIPIDITSLIFSALSLNEGGTLNLSGEFVNIDTLDTHTVTIDWGDGSTPTVLNLLAGDRDFDTSHVYADDNPTATASDNYTVTVTIEDEDGDTGSDGDTVTVNNVNPTIGPISLSASSIDEGQSVTASGLFTDPALGVATEKFSGTATWSDGVVTALSVNSTTGAFSTTRSFPDDHPATGTPSDTFTVDIKIDDDDLGTDTRTSPTLTVNNLDPVMTAFSSDATFEDKAEEGEPVNITGTFTDVGVLDTHTAVVDWGDGSPTEMITLVQGAGFGSVSGSHAYAAGGIYTITLTLTDDDTGTDVATTTAVVTGVGLNFGTLFIIGSSDDDKAHVNKRGKSTIRVHADFIDEPFRDFAISDVDEIISWLCVGDDFISISSGFNLPSVFHGGPGNDELHGGRGSVLLGDAGSDKLVGQSGRDILIGGTGSDVLVGASDDDVLIGGSTDIDDDDGALLAALSTWSSPLSYAERVAGISAALTVTDDAATDWLTGSAGRDLFFDGAGDVLQDGKGNETVL